MRTVEFGSLFEFIRNGMSIKQDKSGEGLPITRIETISEAVVDSSRVGYAGLREKDCNGWLLQPGDILFSHINSVEHLGKCAIYEGSPEKLVHGMNLLCLRPDKSKLIPQFGKYLIRSDAFRSRLSKFVNKSVNQASVSIGNIKPIEVSIPPLPEQKRIAAILDKADSIRRKRQASVWLTEELLRSAFLDLFGDPVTNPKGWSVRSLIDLTTVQSGGTPSTEKEAYWNGNTPWVSPKDMKKIEINDSIDHVSELAFEETNLKKLEPFSVLLVVRGMILVHTVPIAINKCHIAINQDIKAFTCKYNVLPEFLLWNLLVQHNHILSKVATSAHGTKRLEMSEVENLPVLTPSIELQTKFVKITRKFTNVLGAINKSATTYETLFNSLLQGGFNGNL